MLSTHSLNLKGPVPIGFERYSSSKYSIASRETTEQYFIANNPKNGGKACFNSILKTVSLIAEKFFTFCNTQAPGYATFLSKSR